MSKGTKAVVIAIVAVVAGLAAGVLVLQLASSGNAEVEGNLGDAEFDAGYTEVLAREIREGDDQPLIFNDLADGDRDIYVQHRGDDDNTGWTAFETRILGGEGGAGDDDCFAQWDPATAAFFSTCDAEVTFPADGEGLTAYPARVTADERLIVNLRD